MADVPAFDTAALFDTLTEKGEGEFTASQARRLTRALGQATGHVPSREGLEVFRHELRALIAEKLGEQTRWVSGLVFGGFVLNAVAIAGVGLALYKALHA